jgi:hypothetical protein
LRPRRAALSLLLRRLCSGAALRGRRLRLLALATPRQLTPSTQQRRRC